MRQAALFNSGMTSCPGALVAPLPGWRIDAEHTQMTSVKKAEDGSGIVLRFSESAGRQDMLHMTPPADFNHMEICNLLEEPLEQVKAKNGTFSVPVAPWKIVTVKMR